jgi:methionine-rich copper-binding protein CopC
LRNLALSSLAALAIFATSTSAFAHAHLKSASPAPKSVVHSIPKEVAIDFTEALEPKFSAIEVTDASGARVDQNDVHVAPKDAKHLVIGLKPMQAGVYTVTWRATSTDTHKTDGSYTFEIAQ